MNRSHATGLFALVVTIAGLSSLVPGCADRRANDTTPSTRACTACHGSPNNPGSDLVKAAPPIDLDGNTDPSYPGVGAHQFHLQPSKTHAAVACDECHVVPKTTGAVGHADSKRPAELTFGALAKTGDREPSYNPATRACTDSYCHKDSDARWNKPRSSDDACGSCHGLPPPPPHVQVQECYRCHGDVIDENRNFIAPEKHVNGVVDVIELNCSSCHGSDQNPAPPLDTQGNSEITAIGVGAHQVHLAGGANSRPVACPECHTVPQKFGDPGHIDDPPAEVIFTGVATSQGRSPNWDRTVKKCSDAWCHGPSQAGTDSPEWTSTAGNLSCTTCHGAPPPAPHPQMTNCNFCHGDVIDTDNQTIKNRDLHVNGVVDVVLPTTCNACHGSAANPAPPVDLSGNSSTSSPGVGAHQTHLSGGKLSRPVPCEECHIVPASVTDPGHFDTAGPAELNFSGAAARYSPPTFNGVTCEGSWCHGGNWNLHPNNPWDSGGANTSPTWTSTGQVECGSCHSVPPASHFDIQSQPCGPGCHTDFNGFTVTDKSKHVDGIVTGVPDP